MTPKGIFFLLLFSFLFSHGKYSFSQGKKYEIISISDSINSPYDEQAPVLSSDGNTLYFTRSKHPENTGGKKDPGDIWYSEKTTNGGWSIPKNIGVPLNNSQYNAVVGIDGNVIYLIGHYLPNDKRSKTKGVSIAYLSNKMWSFPEPIDILYFSNNSDEQSACLSYNGDILIHSIESYNSRGAEDLYVNFRKMDGSWTDVRNLGSIINSKYQEKTPYLAADNRTLIFSSNGHGGQGSMDLFVSKRLDDSWKNWTVPENMGEIINSAGRELYYYVLPGSEEAIFCSTQNSDGYGDIKYYRLKPEEVIVPLEETIIAMDTAIQQFVVEKDELILKGKVFNAENTEPIAADVSVLLSNENEIVRISTDSLTGEYQIEFSSKNDFLLRIGAKGFMNVEDKVSMMDIDQNLILKNYYLEPLDVGKTFKLNNVLFHRATADLIDSSYAELDNVIRMMIDNPDIYIELSGHTDNQGSARKNLELSQERVEVVKNYLVNKGVDSVRIAGKGYGGSRPIASNRTEETRRLNRRVEFKVIRSGYE